MGIVPCSPPESHRGAALHSPQEAADEAEHMVQGKYTQKCIVLRERQHTAPVVSSGQKTPVCQDDSFAARRGAGSKKEDIAALDRRIAAFCPRRDPVSEIRGQFFYQIRIAAPENIDVRLPDLLLQKSVGGVLIQKNGLQPCYSGSEDRFDTIEGAVAQNAQTCHSESTHLFGAGEY